MNLADLADIDAPLRGNGLAEGTFAITVDLDEQLVAGTELVALRRGEVLVRLESQSTAVEDVVTEDLQTVGDIRPSDQRTQKLAKISISIQITQLLLKPLFLQREGAAVAIRVHDDLATRFLAGSDIALIVEIFLLVSPAAKRGRAGVAAKGRVVTELLHLVCAFLHFGPDTLRLVLGHAPQKQFLADLRLALACGSRSPHILDHLVIRHLGVHGERREAQQYRCNQRKPLHI